MKRKWLFIFFLLLNDCVFAQSQSSISTANKLTKFLNEKKWNELFPHRYKTYPNKKSVIDFYSFKAFKNAAKHFPLFLSEGNDTLQKRELAAFLAIIATETGNNWDGAEGGFEKWGLLYLTEKGCDHSCPQYSDTTKKLYPPVTGKSYHGRGPVQLSWNYNYAQFSEFYFGNKDSLLNHPELLAVNSEISFASALWFWMMPQYPKPSCHAVITNQWLPNVKDSAANRLPGFGAIINIVNGGIECGTNHSSTTSFRYRYYEYFCKYFGVSMGDNSTCTTQKSFGVN